MNLALREFAARHRRIEALEHYSALAAGWDSQDRRYLPDLRERNIHDAPAAN